MHRLWRVRAGLPDPGLATGSQAALHGQAGGRTSKKTPRTGKLFLNWVTEEVLHAVIKNLFEFEAEMLDGKPIYLHMGHLIDRAGYHKFKERVLRGVTLNPEAMVADRIFWAEDQYVANMHVKAVQ